ncbi:unnamed protein product [Didymodactylos carnosus]|uniref:TLDc domain-containing protein n=1 Tax=Didymodactylos carnosus TaxID=1234261 RepID=A0A815DZ34_9BILA|nr:unnamed protein product [Didymodactylos carnosus]CAF1305108.1 unnamed protein product [Didymodactylos carnosus]CAF4107628.1 unnamed protein product [Didymodactylos carnosus]CAF4136920.1 unnamed protein product [Didymodactylos carnosus]
MASSASPCQSIKPCKMSGILPCKGCQRNFCQDHMIEHRQELAGDFQRVLSDRDLLYQQIYCETSSTGPQAFDYVTKWERKTIEKINMIADQARRQMQDLLDETRLKVKEKYDQLSAELRQRQESSHFFEQDIDRLSKTLQQIKLDYEYQDTTATVTAKARTIDFDNIFHITLNPTTNVSQNQLFIGGTLLADKQHQSKLNEFYGTPHQQWELIYKATRDGFETNNFHCKCDGKSPTIVLIQSKNGGYLFGGYTAVPWSSQRTAIRDPTAFIFTLTNPNPIPITNFTIQQAAIDYAVFHHPQAGPIFVEATSVKLTRLKFTVYCEGFRRKENGSLKVT